MADVKNVIVVAPSVYQLLVGDGLATAVGQMITAHARGEGWQIIQHPPKGVEEPSSDLQELAADVVAHKKLRRDMRVFAKSYARMVESGRLDADLGAKQAYVDIVTDLRVLLGDSGEDIDEWVQTVNF